MDAQSSSPTVIEPTANPNADVIAGLREVADFLEAHPEMAKFSGFVHGHVHGADAREVLTTFAETIGPTATENTSYGEVRIAREFSGGVDLELRTSLKNLGAVRPPEPEYEPILGDRVPS